jgi:alpha-tubulin suppressor-like RCC1 family protein
MLHNCTDDITDEGKLLSWGWNEHGQLGVGDVDNRLLPSEIFGVNSVVEADGGYKHTLALTANGNVIVFGENIYGQLGRVENMKSDDRIDLNEGDIVYQFDKYHNGNTLEFSLNSHC